MTLGKGGGVSQRTKEGYTKVGCPYVGSRVFQEL